MRNRSCSRSRTPAAPSSGTRAAASSMASGRPSSRRQMSTTSATLCSLSSKVGCSACTRLTSRATAPDACAAGRSGVAGSDSVATRYRCSSAILSELLAGDQQASLGCALDERLRKRAGGVQEMLAVVEHQQHGAIAQRVDHFVLRAPVARECRAQRLSHGRRQQGRVGHRRQLDHPSAVSELVAQRMRRGLCQPGLANATRTDDANHAVRAAPARSTTARSSARPMSVGRTSGKLPCRGCERPIAGDRGASPGNRGRA